MMFFVHLGVPPAIVSEQLPGPGAVEGVDLFEVAT
jgi:hypothetical protein